MPDIAAVQELANGMDEYTGHDRPPLREPAVLTPKDEFIRWLRKCLIRERNKATLAIPITIHDYAMISQFLDFILFMEERAYYYDYRPIMKDVMKIHQNLHKHRLFLLDIIKRASPEWKERLMRTMKGFPDDSLWLVYADFLEERGDQDGEKIRNLVSK